MATQHPAACQQIHSVRTDGHTRRGQSPEEGPRAPYLRNTDRKIGPGLHGRVAGGRWVDGAFPVDPDNRQCLRVWGRG